MSTNSMQMKQIVTEGEIPSDMCVVFYGTEEAIGERYLIKAKEHLSTPPDIPVYLHFSFFF